MRMGHKYKSGAVGAALACYIFTKNVKLCVVSEPRTQYLRPALSAVLPLRYKKEVIVFVLDIFPNFFGNKWHEWVKSDELFAKEGKKKFLSALLVFVFHDAHFVCLDNDITKCFPEIIIKLF